MQGDIVNLPSPKKTTTVEVNYFAYLLLFYSITVAYVIPTKADFPHAKIFLPILTIVLILQIIYQRSQINIGDIILACSMLGANAMIYSQEALFRFIAPMSLICLAFQGREPIPINRRYMSFLQWYAIPSIIFQLLTYRDVKDFENLGEASASRIVLSNGDTNVSGLFMLIFFFFCFKNNFKPGMILAIITSLIFISRNYIYSLILFYIMFLFEGQLTKLLSKINYSLVFIFSNLGLVLLSEYWVKNVKVSVGYEFGTERFFNVNDQSNYFRFQANNLMVESFFKDTSLAINGFRDKYAEFFVHSGFGLIHNSCLQIIAILGVFLGTFYLWVFLAKVHATQRVENLKYIYTYLFFTLFLHTAFEGCLIQLFIIVLYLPEVSRKAVPQNNMRYLELSEN